MYVCMYNIPEQFTAKAHPALFEVEPKKKVALLFQFTIHIHIPSAQTNCEGSHSVRLLLFFPISSGPHICL